MNQNGNSLAVVLLILTLVAVSFYFLNEKKYTASQVTDTELTESTPKEETGIWKTYTDSSTTLTLDYPEGWTVTEGPKHPAEQAFGYDYLSLTGKEGSVIIHNANQLGGGCDSEYEKIQLKNDISETCHFLRSEGTEHWNQIYFGSANGGRLIVRATANHPIETNRDVILKILSTLAQP